MRTTGQETSMGINLEAQSRQLFERSLCRVHDHALHRPAAGAAALSTPEGGLSTLALRHLDSKLAQAELESIYALAQTPSGLLADEIPLEGEQAPDAPAGLPPFIAPPVAAFAVGLLAQDPKLQIQPLLECATREVDAIWAERLPPDTPLPVILHPRESGLARNPLFEELIDSEDDEEWSEELAKLERSALACRLEPAQALRAGHAFVIEDPSFCGWLLLALEELERAWEAHQNPSTALKLRVRSNMIRDAIEERLWWDEEEIYTAFNRGRAESVQIASALGLVPAASRSLIEEGSAKRAIERHLRPSGSALWTARGLALARVPAGLHDEAQLPPDRWVLPSAQFAPHLALVRAGRAADARVLRGQLEAQIEAHGFRDAYSPIGGEPAAHARSESLSGAIALEMQAADESG